jgi:hypothetical protein
VKARVRTSRVNVPEALRDVNLDRQAMEELWDRMLPIMRSASFQQERGDDRRYFWSNGSFGYGDASVLRAVLHLTKPNRLIEVGSGYSSACSLDTLFDELDLGTEVTLIEPYPDLVRSLVKADDLNRINIIGTAVQDVSLDTFKRLRTGDILFIDSTHIVKTGSDVVHELTNILPVLASGVMIHFHDIFYPFEYPFEWVVEHNRSWNELYALRAFLAYNESFKVRFFSDYLQQVSRDKLLNDYPEFFRNTGGSIWLEKM